MEKSIKNKVIEWAKSGGDFSEGIKLFYMYNRNIFYIRNIELKGIKKGMVTLINEFSGRSGMSYKEIESLIKQGLIDGEGGVQCIEQDLGQTGPKKDVGVVNIVDPSDSARKKLREEFPFLSRKDCPEELMIIVNKMLTAHELYTLNKEKLFDVDVDNLDGCYDAARTVVDDYILNRDCWDELNYYKIHGKVLGKMPEFKIKNMQVKFSEMNTVSLVKLLNNNIPRKMSYYKKQLLDESVTNKDDIREKVSERELEIKIIKEILKDRGEL